MIEFIFSAIGGIVIYYLILHYMPKSIKVKIDEFGANRAYNSATKKLEQTIEKEREELKTEKVDKKLAEENYQDLWDAKKEANETREKFLKLSERFKHDTKKFYEVTADWKDYTKFFADWVDGRCAEYVEPDFEHVKEINIRSQEIIK